MIRGLIVNRIRHRVEGINENLTKTDHAFSCDFMGIQSLLRDEAVTLFSDGRDFFGDARIVDCSHIATIAFDPSGSSGAKCAALGAFGVPPPQMVEALGTLQDSVREFLYFAPLADPYLRGLCA